MEYNNIRRVYIFREATDSSKDTDPGDYLISEASNYLYELLDFLEHPDLSNLFMVNLGLLITDFEPSELVLESPVLHILTRKYKSSTLSPNHNKRDYFSTYFLEDAFIYSVRLRLLKRINYKN